MCELFFTKMSRFMIFRFLPGFFSNRPVFQASSVWLNPAWGQFCAYCWASGGVTASLRVLAVVLFSLKVELEWPCLPSHSPSSFLPAISSFSSLHSAFLPCGEH